jgi:elongation factor 3
MEIKKKAAVTCGNICALVDDVRDLNPFIPALKPELEKCEEHSHPDLRECATKAKAGLLKGLSQSGAGERKAATDCVKDALAAHGGCASLDPVVRAYAASLGGWVIEMAPLRIPPASSRTTSRWSSGAFYKYCTRFVFHPSLGFNI